MTITQSTVTTLHNERTTHRNIIKSLNSYYSNRLSILVETIGFNFKE